MHRILVADDEPATLSKLNTILSRVAEVEAATDGTEAVGYYIRSVKENRPFDLVALDVDMPHMAGTVALQRIRQFEAALREEGTKLRVPVVMITSHTDRRHVEMSIRHGCSGYLVKPVKPADVYRKLAELGLVSGPVEGANPPRATTPPQETSPEAPANTSSVTGERVRLKHAILEKVKEIKSGSLPLPAQPDVYIELKKLVAGGADLEQVANLLKAHPTITGRLINLSNTSRYRGQKENKSLADAIGRLGLDETVEQVCAIATQDMCTNVAPKYKKYGEELWQHSLACAYACEILANTLDVDLDVDPFTMGLMHDVGKVGLLRIFESLEASGLFGKEVQWEDMAPVLSQYEGVLGAILLKQWRLPEKYQEVARYHNDTKGQSPATDEIKVTKLSIDLSQLMFSTAGEIADETVISTYQTLFPGLTWETIEEVLRQTQAAFSEGLKAMA